ncbi:rab-GTPase-TBC domain-containing protein [Hyaloraphidium curvatum]|nr:rab-GTPase-TBC domain-containing protein [Hyaloraphidium curvatum]
MCAIGVPLPAAEKGRTGGVVTYRLHTELAPVRPMFGVRRGVCPRRPRAADARLAAATFVAAGGDGAGQPPAARVFGRLRGLLALRHPHVARLVDAAKGRRDRLYAVSEHCADDAARWRAAFSGHAPLPAVRAAAFELLAALVFLHDNAIAVGNLSARNVLLAGGPGAVDAFPHRVKLAAWALCHASAGGADVAFPVTDPFTVPPEAVADPGHVPDAAADVWAFGVLLVELWTGTLPLFAPPAAPDEGPDAFLERIRASLAAVADLADVPDPSGPRAGGHPALDDFFADASVDLQLRDLAASCLRCDPASRPSSAELFSHPFFDAHPAPRGVRDPEDAEAFSDLLEDDFLDAPPAAPPDPVACLDLATLYHLWRLAGGDLDAELSRQGALAFHPAVARVPRLARLAAQPEDAAADAGMSDPARAFCDRAAVLDTSRLEERLRQAVPAANGPAKPPRRTAEQRGSSPFYWDDPLLLDRSGAGRTTTELERDPVHQMAKLEEWRDLLLAWPANADDIAAAAKGGIPPLLRGRIWAALLGIRGDPSVAYGFHDLAADSDADRQLDLDIPRCHQYDDAMATPQGHAALRRLLKGLLAAERGRVVYWQGMDSLAATFLSVSWEDEALAFCCFRAFVERYLARFFVHDNSTTIQEYMISFRHILSYHDPELSTYADRIGLQPDLFAIPWFMTLFAHVFSLGKVHHLYDKVLVGPPGLPLFVGVGVLRQMRDKLLVRDFNDCMLLFADLPDTIEIDACLDDSLRMLRCTPPTLLPPDLAPRNPDPTDPASVDPLQRKRELAGRISLPDAAAQRQHALLLDVRGEDSWTTAHALGSVGVFPPRPQGIRGWLHAVGEAYGYITVVGDEENDGMAFCEALVRAGFSRVALLNAPFDEVGARGELPLCPCEGAAEVYGSGAERTVVLRCQGVNVQ